MAGLTPAVSSAFGNDPGSLPADAAPPTPDMPDLGGVGNIVSPRPSPMQPPAQPAADPFAALDQNDPFSALGPDVASADGSAPADAAAPDAAPSDMSTQPDPTGFASIKEQFNEALARIKNSFAVTPAESVGALKKLNLFDDVRSQGGTVQVKRKGRNGWEPLDRDKIELIGDTLDFARDGVEAIIENAGRIGGAAGGALVGAAEAAPAGAAAGTVVAPGPGTAVGGAAGAVSGGMAGAVPGGIAGGAAAAVAAKNVGDVIAEKLLGIERDPNRSATEENAVAGAMGAGFSFLASRFARRQAARAAVQKETAQTVEHAMTEVGKTMQDIAEVQKSGIKLGENGRFSLDPQQLIGKGTIPEIDVTARELSTEQSFRNFRQQVGDSLQSAYDSVARSLGAQSGKGAQLGDDFVLSANDVRKAEGAAIGSFRSMAKEAIGTKKLPAQQTSQVAADLLAKYGGKLETVSKPSSSGLVDSAGKALSGATDVSVKLPSVQTILRDNPALSETQAKLYRAEIANLARRTAKGNGTMRIDDMEVLYNDLTRKINNSIDTPNGRAYAKQLIQLKNAVREDWTNMIGQALPESQQAAYQQAKVRYGQLIAATDQLGKVLETDNLSKNELIGKLFEGKGSYKFAQSAKTLIQETNPELWDNLTSEYFRKLRNDATDAAGKNVNWNQMTKKWRDLDPRLQGDLLASTGIKPEAMTALLNLGVRVQNTSFEALPKEAQAGFVKRQMKNVLVLASNAIGLGQAGAAAKTTAVTSMIEGMGKEQAMAKWLKAGGMEELLREMPGMRPDVQARLRTWIGNWTPAPVRNAAKAVPAPVKTVGKAAVNSARATGKTAIRNELQRDVAPSSDVPGADAGAEQ